MFNLATSADQKFLPFTYVMVFSLLEQHPQEQVRVFLLHGGLTEEDLTPLHELCASRKGAFVPLLVDHSEFANLGTTPEAKSWPPSAYYRLRLLDLLPEDVDRLLYLDGDIIVNKNLTDLYHTGLGENLIAACTDMVSFEEKRKSGRVKAWPRMLGKLLEEDRYFNSGMILMDVERLRKKYSFETYRELMEANDKEIRYPDQDLLNLVHQDETLILDAWKYNCMPYNVFRIADKSCEELKESAYILHFAGPKPWDDGDHIHYETEQLWWDAALKTPYKQEFLIRFLQGSLRCRSLEEEIRRLYDENARLKEGLESIKHSLTGLVKL